MLDIGVGIAIAGVAVAAAPVAITAIKVRISTNGNNKVCPLHSGIEEALDNLQGGMKIVQEDIKELLKRGT